MIATILTSVSGCSEPSPLSPTADQDPARHALAVREMGDVARRNRDAEAAFFRKLKAATPAIPEA